MKFIFTLSTPFMLAWNLIKAIFAYLRDVRVFTKFFLTWFLVNIAVSFIPILGNILDGVCFVDVVPSILMVFVVILASNSYMLIRINSEKNKDFYFSLSIISILLLVMLSTKFPFGNIDLKNFLFKGWRVYLTTFIISSGCVLLAWIIYWAKALEDDVEEAKAKKAIKRSERKTAKQDLSKATEDEVD